MRTVLEIATELKRVEREYEKVGDSRKVNHILHLILSIITLGWWIPVWILLVLNVDTRQISLPRKIKKLEDELIKAQITEEYR